MNNDELLATVLNDEGQVWKLTYLVDIFGKIEDMTLSWQKKAVKFCDANAKVSSFKRILEYCLE